MSQRYEREIEEILRKAGSLGPAPTTRRAPVQERGTQRPWEEGKAGRTPRIGGYWARLSTNGQIMLGSLILGVVAFVVRFQSPEIGFLIAMVATVLFFIAYLSGFRGPQNLGSERRWRGERVDYQPYQGPSPIDQIKEWWQRRKYRR